MRTIVVPVPESVAERIAAIARAEFRTPKAQAVVLIIEALSRRGAIVELRTAERAALERRAP
jgi:hypothetical protein